MVAETSEVENMMLFIDMELGLVLLHYSLVIQQTARYLAMSITMIIVVLYPPLYSAEGRVEYSTETACWKSSRKAGTPLLKPMDYTVLSRFSPTFDLSLELKYFLGLCKGREERKKKGSIHLRRRRRKITRGL